MITSLKFKSITFSTSFSCPLCSADLDLIWTHLGYMPLLLQCIRCGQTTSVDARLDVRPIHTNTTLTSKVPS